MKKTHHLKKAALLLLIGAACSCSNEATLDQELENTSATQDTFLNNNLETLTDRTTCSESSFPKLGPGATRGQVNGCKDVSNPNNIGTLDCRSNAGGYSNSGDFGKYEIRGSNNRFDGTRTRVERFFNGVRRKANTSSKLSYRFVIDDLSDDKTCIVQAHATGSIVEGKRTGQQATSAVFLLYATKSRNADTYNLHVHESTTPFTTTNRGTRTITFFRSIRKGVEYNLTYRTGYDANNKAFSALRVYRGNNSKYMKFNHNYTTENVGTRYGAYGASDSGRDRSVSLRIKNTRFCRLN